MIKKKPRIYRKIIDTSATHERIDPDVVAKVIEAKKSKAKIFNKRNKKHP